MDSDQTGEEIVAICSDCDAVYPAIRLPDGEVRRVGSYPRCRCGSKSFVEIENEQ